MKNISRSLKFLEWHTKSLPEDNEEQLRIKSNLKKITEVLRLEQTKTSYLEKVNDMNLDDERKYKIYNNIIDLFEQLKNNIFEGKKETEDQIRKRLILAAVIITAEAI